MPPDLTLSAHVRDTGIAEPARHDHVPLVRRPYGYSTDRGSS